MCRETKQLDWLMLPLSEACPLRAGSVHSTSDTVYAVLMLMSGLLVTGSVCGFCCKLVNRRNQRRMDLDAAERRDVRRR
eukprot:COSAG02_NODE_28677_length_584_cov_39.660322_1_plen_78_part_10